MGYNIFPSQGIAGAQPEASRKGGGEMVQEGLGFRVQGCEWRIQGLGFRV